MKILVTGSSGFFGSWLIPALTKEGHTVIGYDLKDGNDINNLDQLKGAMAGCDAVIHLAAIPHYKPGIPWDAYEKINIHGTANVAGACFQLGIKRMVMTSSGAVYGFDIHEPGFKNPPLKENDLPDLPDNSTYGRSKQKAEFILRKMYADVITITCLRVNMIEPFQNTKYHHGWWCKQETAIKAYLAALKRNGKFLIVNVGEPNANLDMKRMERLIGNESLNHK